MNYQEDLQMQILLSRKRKNSTNINKALEQYNEHMQCLPNLDSCNTKLSMKVKTKFNDLKKKQVAIRNLNLEKETLGSKQTHIDQCIRSKMTDIENMEKKKQDLLNIRVKFHSYFDEQVSDYEATLEAMATKYKESPKFYNEDFITTAIEKTNTEIQNLQQKVREADEQINSLEEELKSIKECVPEDILNIVGKEKLQKQLESVTSESETLQETHDKMVAEETKPI